jgi:hypothetical protein
VWYIPVFVFVQKGTFPPNTDHHQQVEDVVRGCTWQLTKVKTICRFHKLVFYRGDSSLERFKLATHNYCLWQSVPVRYSSLIGWSLEEKIITRDAIECNHIFIAIISISASSRGITFFAQLTQRVMWAFAITWCPYLSEPNLGRNLHWVNFCYVYDCFADWKFNMAARDRNRFWMAEIFKDLFEIQSLEMQILISSSIITICLLCRQCLRSWHILDIWSSSIFTTAISTRKRRIWWII